MNVIDKILNEWSFRCHDGIVDINDPKKAIILNEILGEFGLLEETIEDDILNAVIPLSDEEKQKVLGYINNKFVDLKGKEEQSKKAIEIEDILKKKDIPEDVLDLIVLRSEKRDLLVPLKNLINSTTLKELGEEGKLKVDSELMWINNATATQSSLSLGKGEILLTIMLKDAILAKTNDYDIDINNEKVEVKQSGRNKEGKPTGAIISKAGRSSNYENVWTNDFKNKYFGPEYEGKLSSWNTIYNKYKQLEPSLQSEFINDINNLVFKKYNSKLENSDFEGNLEKLCKKVAYNLVGTYLENKILIILSSDLQYLVLNEKTYLEQILTNDELRANSSFIPRISYKEIIPTEDSEDLSDEESNPPTKPKLSAPEKVQQNIKKQEEKTEEEILKDDSKARQFKDNFEKAKEELENIRKIPDYFKKPEYKKILDRYNFTKKQYDDYILQSKKIRKNFKEELTNYLIKAFTEE